MATLRIGFPLPLRLVSSAPFELPKEREGANDKVYKIVLFVLSELHGRVASQVGSAEKLVALRHMPVTLQLSFTHFETHVQMLAQSGSRHLNAAAHV